MNNYTREKLKLFSNKELSVSIINSESYKNKDNKTINSQFDYDMGDGRGLYLSPMYEIEIMSELHTYKGKFGDYKNKISLKNTDFWLIENSLEKVTEWLTSPKCKDLFYRNEDGTIINPNIDKYKLNLNISNTQKLIIVPTTLSDISNCKYEGIELKCETGIIGSLSPYEFMFFKKIIKNVMENILIYTMHMAEMSKMNYIISLLEKSQK